MGVRECNMDSLGKTCGLYREAMGVLVDDGRADVQDPPYGKVSVQTCMIPLSYRELCRWNLCGTGEGEEKVSYRCESIDVLSQ